MGKSQCGVFKLILWIGRKLSLFGCLLILFILVACGRDTDADVPLIFAAASLSDVLADSAEVYEKQTGKQVDFSFGGSLTLANQIASLGAPADGVFLVGDVAIGLLGDAGLLDADGYDMILFNQLAVIGSKGVKPLANLVDLRDRKGRIAIGNPELSPAGEYAKQAIENSGIWEDVGARLVMTSDVRSAMASLISGNVEFAVVYVSDVNYNDGELFDQLIVLDEGYDRIFYAFAPIIGSENNLAVSEFISFLSHSIESKGIFSAAGFGLNPLKES